MDASKDQMERRVHFRISGLEPTQFTHLFHLSEEELASHIILRYVVTAKPGFPCRVSLQDAEPGEKVLLLNYIHLDTTTPYRASHAIFVRENATPAELDIDEIPDSIRNRLMSVRAVEFVHLHNAKRVKVVYS